MGVFMALAAPMPAMAEDSELWQLRDELERVRRSYEIQLQLLEQRLRQVEERALSERGKGPATETQQAPSRADDPQAGEKSAEAAAPASGEGEVRRPPISRSTEAIYQEQGALFQRRFTLETGFSYARTDSKQLNLSGFLAADAVFLGNISVDTVKADILTFDVLGRWGLSNRLQMDVHVPFLYRRTVYQSGGVGGDAARLSEVTVTMDPDFRAGDMDAGVYYQLKPETANSPDIVWNLRVKAPTGSHPYGVKLRTDPTNDNLTYPEELPSGNGVWTVSTGLSWVKTVDPAILFANVSYFYNIDRHFSDISSEAGTTVPGRIDLGDSFQYGLGTAFALSERMSISMSYSHRFTNKTRTRPDGGDWSSVLGSDANVATLNLGLTYAMSDRLSLVTNLGVGLTPDAPDLQFGMKFPYAF